VNRLDTRDPRLRHIRRIPSISSHASSDSTVLVTGANGHLGHNLVLELRAQGQRVIAGVRHHHHHAALAALGCRVAQVEMLDRYSLEMAMDGVDTVYQVAAVFKHWARDPEREIYRANIEGTRNVLEAAAATSVRRVVYVSSLAALDRSKTPITEEGWNLRASNVYFRSKVDSEKLAWDLAEPRPKHDRGAAGRERPTWSMFGESGGRRVSQIQCPSLGRMAGPEEVAAFALVLPRMSTAT
jgi:NAD(P)-dependent dehydrogenase (short-subunit alcohol dehydrogenase family)